MFPRGWYVVGSGSDVAAGEVKTVHYFGQDIVLFQGNCLRCPFHDWALATDGHCVEIPYAPKIPPKAVVKTWPMREDCRLMINGDLNGARAFSTGRGRLRGPVRLAMKMQKLFPLDRAV